MSAEEYIVANEIELPPPSKALGLYRPIVLVDSVAYLSGHVPSLADGSLIRGRLGADLDVEAGSQAARQAGLATLATLRDALGTLDRVKRLIKTFGLVQCTDDFVDQPAVVNGFSELMRDVFGHERGVGARSAVGSRALPAAIAVEIESVFEIEA